MSASPVRPFNAINGDELKKAILNNIKMHLDADSRFRLHLTYPQFTARWKLAIDAYPMEPPNFEISPAPMTLKTGEVPEGTKVVEIDLGGEINANAPSPGAQTADAVRRDAGIGVPVPTAVKGPSGDRVTVDQSPVGPQKNATPGVDENDQRQVTNVEEGGRVFGRSVAIKTAANPGGTEVDGPGGTKPDMERVQEILAKEEADAVIDRQTPDPAA